MANYPVVKTTMLPLFLTTAFSATINWQVHINWWHTVPCYASSLSVSKGYATYQIHINNSRRRMKWWCLGLCPGSGLATLLMRSHPYLYVSLPPSDTTRIRQFQLSGGSSGLSPSHTKTPICRMLCHDAPTLENQEGCTEYVTLHTLTGLKIYKKQKQTKEKKTMLYRK